MYPIEYFSPLNTFVTTMPNFTCLKDKQKVKTTKKRLPRRDLIKKHLCAVSAGSGNIVARNSLGGITFTIDTLDSEPKRKVFKS